MENSARKKLLLIDTFNFLHRAYHALPKTFRDQNGDPTNAVYGVTSMLISIFEAIKPNYVVAAMDDEKPTFRVEDFTGYKAHRIAMEDELSSQIPKVFEILSAFGIKQILLTGYEADDVIGTMAQKFGKDSIDVIIVSNDRDLWQLVNDNVLVMCPSNKTGQMEWIGKEEVKARLGFNPKQIPDFKALRGDASDNIPGVYGIGEKTAAKLIQEFGSVEEIYKNIDRIEPLSLREKLANNAEEAAMSKRLAKIITDAPLTIDLSECKYKEFNKGRVVEVLRKYNFKSLIRRLGFGDEPSKKTQEVSEDQLSLL